MGTGLGVSGRIAEYFLRNSLTPLIALIALLLGIGATLITPREEEPQINVTMANVFVPFPGAAARDVEALVARPAEQVLSRIAGIEHVYSVSRPGMAVITVQYEVGEDPIQALVRLYDTINSHKDWLSPNLGVLDPIVKPKGIDDVPIVTLTFHSADPAKSAFEMQQVARAAEIDLKRIPGTRDVATIGGPGHVIRVIMDADRMNAHGITAQDLKAALQVSNASQPAGALVSGNRELLVQTGTYIESAADVKRLVVGVYERKPVYLADVAQVIDGADQPSRYVWHGTKQGESPAVTLSVSKKPGVNAADVAESVIARAEALRGTVIPDGVEFTVTRNYGATATDKAQKLIGKLVFATAFVVLLVLFALGRREAVIVGAAVTLTLAATLFASWAYGFTLNRVSLFALIFSIGILVDDAIVVVENIHRWTLLHPDKPLWEIIPPAVDEVGGPTILATFTVIAALLPMAFVTGLMGPYMSPIPINASMGMFISLAIAFVITPWLALEDDEAGGARRCRPWRSMRRPPSSTACSAASCRRCSTRAPAARAAQAVDRCAGRDPGVGQPRLLQAGGTEDAALRQQERIPDRARHAGRHAARRNREGVARDLRRDRPGAGSRRLPGLRRHRRADQLQRPGAPVLPAQRAGDGRHPGQPGRTSSIATGRATRSPSRCAIASWPWRSSTAAMPRSSKCRPARR
jgi:multidrug efflux pump subunit AcrB